MTEPPNQPPKDPRETPMQRALRLKKQALEARPKGSGAGKVQRGSAAMPTGASKPWMKGK
jgi:hypothetical protein